jgi:hypothetical protein
MSGCTPPGWSTNNWGWIPWGSPTSYSIPNHDPFLVYCIGPCNDMEDLANYSSHVVLSGNYYKSIQEQTYTFYSDDGVESSVIIKHNAYTGHTGTASSYTFDFTVRFINLPNSIIKGNSDVYAFFGVWEDDEGNSFGIFFSNNGIGVGSNESNVNYIIKPEQLKGLHIQEGVKYTFRFAVNGDTKSVYVYASTTQEVDSLGRPIFRGILPLPGNVGSGLEQTTVKVKGSSGNPVKIELFTICLADVFLATDSPPLAIANDEIEIQLCEIAKLDGSRSYDPEGTDLTYTWRVIDGPIEESNIWMALDGRTNAGPPQWTDTIYTSLMVSEFPNPNPPPPLQIPFGPGDVVLINNKPYNISAVYDDRIVIDGAYLEAGISSAIVKVIKQNILITNPSSPYATFFPDAKGSYKLDLTVSDGVNLSEPSIAVVNVKDRYTPLEYTPDGSYLWSYLSNFWRNVEGKEPITAFFSAFIQLVSSGLHNLWQVDDNKSLKYIQPLFTKKWLYYDLLLQEPYQNLTEVSYIGTGILQGSGGVASTPPNRTTYTLDTDYSSYDIQPGDWLVLDNKGFTISNVSLVASKTRLTVTKELYGTIYTNIPNWAVVRPAKSKIIDFWKSMVVAGDILVIGVADSTSANYIYSDVLAVNETDSNAIAFAFSIACDFFSP